MLFAHGDMSGVAYYVLSRLCFWGLCGGFVVAAVVAISTKKPRMLLWTPLFAVAGMAILAVAFYVWMVIKSTHPIPAL